MEVVAGGVEGVGEGVDVGDDVGDDVGAVGAGRVTTVPLSGRYSGPVWPQPARPAAAISIAVATGARVRVRDASVDRAADLMRG